MKFEKCSITPEYSHKDDLILIKPYNFTYNVYVKNRWKGKTLLEFFKTEFKKFDQAEDYYSKAIENGQIRVNKKLTSPDLILKDNMLISHQTVFEENSVYDRKIRIIYEDDEILVVDKPSSIPVHTCGSYRFNTLLGHLKYLMNHESDLANLHRIDKVTSGIVLLSKNKNNFLKYQEQLQFSDLNFNNIAQLKDLVNLDFDKCKTYKAKIEGNMLKYIEEYENYISSLSNDNYEEEILTRFLDYNNSIKNNFTHIKEKFRYSYRVGPHSILIFSKLFCYCKKYSTYGVSDMGKSAISIVSVLDPNQPSLVTVKILTGRTHQIRVHLASVGLHIVKDIVYQSVIIDNEYYKIQGCQLVRDGYYEGLEMSGKIYREFEVRSNQYLRLMEIYLHHYSIKLRVKDEWKTFTTELPSFVKRLNV